MDVLPWVLSSGWASGLNGYAVVFLLGLIGRLTEVSGVPPALERTDVLVAAGLLAALDLVADKIPYVDSAWDTVHTFIRPAIGAALGALLAGEAGSLSEAVGAATGGVTALISHLVKAGLRVAVNTSPEPVSNLVVSTTEDVAVATVVGISAVLPWLAAAISLLLLAAALALAVTLLGAAGRVRRRLGLGGGR